jgi:hypothetical protein
VSAVQIKNKHKLNLNFKDGNMRLDRKEEKEKRENTSIVADSFFSVIQ